MNYKCSRCKKVFPKRNQVCCYNTQTNKNGEKRHYYHCTDCNTKRSKKYRETEAGKQAFRDLTKRFIKKNKDKKRAWILARKLKVQPCEVCGKTTGRIHRHHDDYSRPLDVNFLCPKHHKERHLFLSKSIQK